ncbi:MAG: GGDEF domain-containing response regulator [Silvibacterium sp.]
MIPSAPAAPRLLVATANRELDRRITEILAGVHYSVQTVPEGTEALSILLGPKPPEVALLDAELPGQNGLELAAEIKRRSSRKQTWIVLLSTAADAVIIAAAADAGVDDLLLCPDGDLVNETDLRIRLGVAARVKDLASQLEAQIQAVSFHSLHDSLTGLWSRETMLSLLFPETDRVQRLGTPLGFLLLDLDHFARVNAEYGYETGDKILQDLASRLRRYMRSYDMLGRSGDDAFLIALPGCNAHQTRHFAGRLRTFLLQRPFAAGNDSIPLTASIGLAQSKGRSPLVVLREAERALALAKLEGRNCEREYIAPPAQEKILENQLA